jgi:hypothetical protein
MTRRKTAQLVVRSIEERVKRRLQERARRNGRSMEEEVRQILTSAVSVDDPAKKGFGTGFASFFRDVPEDLEIKEIHGELPRPVRFDE